jgi:hypothetical protein
MERFDEKPLRIPVLDKYKESGKLHILGKVETGVLKTGDSILCNPGSVRFFFLIVRVGVFFLHFPILCTCSSRAFFVRTISDTRVDLQGFANSKRRECHYRG